MEPRHQEYSLLAVSKFNVYILEKFPHNNAFLQKMYIVKSHDVIQAATLVISSPVSRVIVASKTTVWGILVPTESKNNDRQSKRPSKRRKLEDTPEDHEDIFADLLSEEDTGNTGNVTLFQPELTTQRDVSSLLLDDKHILCSLDSVIIDIAVSDDILVTLVEEEAVAYIKVFTLEERKARCIQSIPTNIEARLFLLEPNSSSAKPLHLVVNQGAEDTEKAHTSSQGLNLPTSLFIHLFGKEAACLRSPIVLLCDIKGCIYFCQIKLIMPQPKRLMVFCETNSQVVSISKVEFDCRPKEETAMKRDTITMLESVLGDVRDAKRQGDAFSISGLMTVSETGQCCMFLPNEPVKEVLISYLPHSIHSCIVKGSQIFYSTESSIEVCDVIITRHKDNNIRVSFKQKISILTEHITHLVSINNSCYQEKDVIVGMTDELKLVHFPFSRDKSTEIINADRPLNSLVESNLNCSPAFFEATRSAEALIDSCLLQLNLFSSIVKQQRVLMHAQTLKNDDVIVTCKCSILSMPTVPCIWFQVHLTNTTSFFFTKYWKVNVSVVQGDENNSTSPRHFTFPLNNGLPPKSIKEMALPLPSPPAWKLKPVYLRVSLVLAPDVVFAIIKKWPGHVNKPLFVKICEECFDVMDYMQITSSADPVMDCGRTNEICSTSQPSDNISTELAKCLLLIPKVRPLRDSTEQIAHPGNGGSPTFPMTLLVPEALCKELHLQAAVDVVRLLLAPGRSKELSQLQLSQIQLKTLADGILISMAVAENPVPLENCLLTRDAKEEQKKSAFVVTLRSSNLILLLASRASIKTRLKNSHSLNGRRDVIPLTSTGKLNQQLQRYERLMDELMVKSSNSSQEGNLCHEIHCLCDLFDKYELIQ